MQRFLFQTLPLTFGTFANTIELFCPFLGCSPDICVPHLLYIFDQTTIFYVDVVCSPCLGSRNTKSLGTTFQYLANCFFRHIAKRCISSAAILFEQRLHLPEYHCRLCLPKRRKTAFAQRKRRIWDNLILVYNVYEAKSLTTRTSTLRTVKRKVMRSRVVIRHATRRAHQVLAVVTYRIIGHIANKHLAITLLHSNSNTLNKPLVIFMLYLKTVDDNFNAMIAIAVEFHVRKYFLHLTIDTNVQITLSAYSIKEFLVVAFTVLYKRRKQDNAFSEIFVEQEFKNLFLRISNHLLSTNIRISLGSASIEQTQEVINFCCRTDCTSRILIRSLLLNADNRT